MRRDAKSFANEMAFPKISPLSRTSFSFGWIQQKECSSLFWHQRGLVMGIVLNPHRTDRAEWAGKKTYSENAFCKIGGRLSHNRHRDPFSERR